VATMTMIVGCKCDGCGVAELMDEESDETSGYFPPTGWYSITRHYTDGLPEDRPRAHACSEECLLAASRSVIHRLGGGR